MSESEKVEEFRIGDGPVVVRMAVFRDNPDQYRVTTWLDSATAHFPDPVNHDSVPPEELEAAIERGLDLAKSWLRDIDPEVAIDESSYDFEPVRAFARDRVFE